MDQMQDQPTGRSWRSGFILFFALAALLCAAAFLVGISDNPPGILLAYGACACVILAWAHRWRRPGPFLKLAIASLVGFFVGAVLHNLLYAVAHSWPNLPGVILGLVEGLHVAFFLIAVLLCPPGVLIGVIGWLSTGIWRWAHHRHAT